MEINEKLVKISMSPAETDKTYKLGDEVNLKVKGDVVKIEHRDNQDGTENLVFVVKAIEVSDE